MEDIQKDRIALAIDFAKTHNCTLVLKGSDYTTITDGKTTYLLICPNSGMGKGGSGDVLSGMVSSFIAQGIEPLEACKLAVYVHSQAGLQCAEKLGEYSMLPTDVISEIPQVLKGLTQV
jgi:NAD(P)H-hydrate epimerase